MTEHASRQNTSFPSGGGQAHGYLALPPSGTGPGVVVIQEWWGLTDHIAALGTGGSVPLGLEVSTFSAAVIGSIIISVISSIIAAMLVRRED